MVRALLWDHDGVLVDTEHLYFQATRELLATVGAELSEALYRARFLVDNSGAWQLAAERGASETAIAELKQRRNQRYTELLLETDVLVPSALETLDALRSRFRMAIVTSSRRVHFEAIHRTSGLPERFEFALVREDYEHSKPHPEPYLRALARMKLEAADCLVIEDSERGLRAATAAGLRCFVVPSRLTEGSDFALADRRFGDLAELRDALLQDNVAQ